MLGTKGETIMITKQSNDGLKTKSRVEKKHKEKQEKATVIPKSPDIDEKTDAAKTRKQQKAERNKEKKKNKKPRRRIFPIWLRIIVVLLLCVGGLVLGAMVGYGIIGNGDPKDVLNMETWQHIIDIVKKKE